MSQPIPLTSRRRSSVLPLLFVVASLLLAAPLWADRSIDRTLPASATGVVEIDNVSGEISVEGWDRSEVQVTGRIGDQVEDVDIDDRGGRIVIDVDLPRRTRGDASAYLVVRVPRGSEVRAEGVSADVRVRDVTGRLELSTVSGGVEVQGGASDVDAETVSGNIALEGMFSEVRAEAVSGRITLEGGSQDVRATTVSGGVELDLERLGRVEVEAVSGNVEITADAVDRDAVVDAGTHSGSARLAIPKSISARISLQTHSGGMRNDLGPEPERPRYGPGRSVEFTLGTGDARIRVQTFSGSVSLIER